VLDAWGPAPGHPGPGCSLSPPDVSGAALPFRDGLVVVASDGAVAMLDAAGRGLWEALQAGCTIDDLVEASVEHGGLPIEAARANVASALESWRGLGLIDAPGQEAETTPVVTPVPSRRAQRRPALDAVYLLGDRPVRARCEDVVIGELIDVACGAYRVDGDGGALACVDMIEQDDGFAVSADDAMLACTEAATPLRVVARYWFLMALLETARHRRRWLGILHASAVSLGGRCVLFPGIARSGKSTLAAALVAAGAEFVTDDHAPLEQASWRVWPVPYAPRIKHGSWSVLRQRYPELLAAREYELEGVRVRHLALDRARVAPLSSGLPVEALVFPRYQADVGLEERRLSATEAFAGLFQARSKLDLRPDFLAETLRWVESVPAYQLIFCDLDRAIEWVLSLWCRK
jgi:hypothetical protein